MKQWKTFIADDEPNARLFLKGLLASYPQLHIAGCAGSGTDALDQLVHGSFDLAFLDISMPGRTGIEALKEIRAQRRDNLPYVIFVTAFTNHGAEAYDLGAVDYIVKPVSEHRLAQAIDRFFRFTESEHTAEKNDAVAVFAQSYGLTDREKDICIMIKNGCPREDLQKKLNISAATLKTHLAHIYDKAGFSGDEKGRADKFARLLYTLFTLE